MEREFRVIPESEPLIPGKNYYYDMWSSLSKEILESHGKKLLRLSKIYRKGKVIDADTIVLEEYPLGKAPGNIKHSFYVKDDLVFTYVI